MQYFLSIISAFLFAGCILVIGVQNPIHSILTLILVFLLGSMLLFMLQVEYFAILFTIVYVGAIVVLFLFIVMMLEIKMVNVSERFRDLFSFRNIIISFLLLEVLLLTGEDFFEVPNLLNSTNNFIFFEESNLYVDYSKMLQRPDHLRGIGGVLFTEYKLSVLLAALLLFLSMVGSIVVTMETSTLRTLKGQDPNHQTLRHPSLLSNSFRGL